MQALTHNLSALEETAVKTIIENTIASDLSLNAIKLLNGLYFDNIIVRDKIINFTITNLKISSDISYQLFYYASALTTNKSIRNLDEIKKIFSLFFTLNQEALLYIFTHS